MDYIFAKDNEGFVIKKKKSELLPDEQIITEEKYNELSGENYYREKFTHGGARQGAGRKKKDEDNVLKFQVRVSKKEKSFLDYARSHHLNYDELMEG